MRTVLFIWFILLFYVVYIAFYMVYIVISSCVAYLLLRPSVGCEDGVYWLFFTSQKTHFLL